MTHILSRCYHIGGHGANSIELFDLADRRSMWLGQHIDRTGLQVVVWPDDRQGTLNAISDKLLIIGGRDNSPRKTLDSAVLFDTTQSTSYEANLKLSAPRSSFGAVTHNGLLYILGGNDTKTTLSLFE